MRCCLWPAWLVLNTFSSVGNVTRGDLIETCLGFAVFLTIPLYHSQHIFIAPTAYKANKYKDSLLKEINTGYGPPFCVMDAIGDVSKASIN